MNSAEPTHATETTEPRHVDESPEAAASPRADLYDAIGWILLGLVVVVLSLQMDRLQDRHINPLTIPGLVPGLLGAGMVIVGTILGLRSWARGALYQALPAAAEDQRQRRLRVLLAVILCCGYSVVLLGHGLPFWVASSIYVTCSILAFDRMSSDPAKRRIGWPAVAKALLIGVLSSVAVWLVFERVFLVRLP
jgi:hypothetical protein